MRQTRERDLFETVSNSHYLNLVFFDKMVPELTVMHKEQTGRLPDMRIYRNTKERVLEKLVCNGCGKEVPLRRGMPLEGVFHVRFAWDYMSDKDGMMDTFDLCEGCYDRFTEAFQVPLTRNEVTEFL